MCLQDMAIERKLTHRRAAYNATLGAWVLPANPIRHSLVVIGESTRVEVIAGTRTSDPYIALIGNAVWDGAAPFYLPITRVLRTDEYGDSLCGPLVITNGTTASAYAPIEVFPTVDLDPLIERALPK